MPYDYVRPMTTQDIAVQTAQSMRRMGDILSKPFMIQLDRQLRQQDRMQDYAFETQRDERRMGMERDLSREKMGFEKEMLGIKNQYDTEALKQKFGFDLFLAQTEVQAQESKYADYYGNMKKYKEWEIANTPRQIEEPMYDPATGKMMMDINNKPVMQKVYRLLDFGDEQGSQPLPNVDFGYRPGLNSMNSNQVLPESMQVISRPEPMNTAPARSPLMQDLAQGGTFTDKAIVAGVDAYNDFTNNFNNVPTQLFDPYMSMGTAANNASGALINDLRNSRALRAAKTMIRNKMAKNKAVELFLQKLFNQ